MDSSSDTAREAFRRLPAVEALLARPDLAGEVAELGRTVVRDACRRVLEAWRREVREGKADARAIEARLERGELLGAVRERLACERRAGLVRAINATGVVLHTGLGRAPVHPEVAAAMERAARSYAVLEVSRETGVRNRRDDRLAELLARATGAEAACAVNNCAAAVLLALNTLARGREVPVSRGELVEIGGSFRMPDVMERAGALLVEVGTTNRTRLEDYEAAIGERTGLLLKVHTSNFRVQGFVQSVDADVLAELGHTRGLPVVWDLGSGRLDPPGATALEALGDEVGVEAAVASGVDLVLFSGDKLLGAPQAGLLAGRAEAVAACRRNPLYRALRLDKVALAGLETTFELLLAGRGDELPARRMLLASPGEVAASAERIARALDALPGLSACVVEARSQPGSGAAPLVYLPTRAVAVDSQAHDPDALAAALRRAEPPVFARIAEDRLLLDPRTLLQGDEDDLVAAFGSLVRL